MSDVPDVALSIRQPWVWAILTLGKDIENRGWPTKFRGPFAIHASRGMTHDEYTEFIYTALDINKSHPFPPGMRVPPFKELTRGGIVGMAELVDCVPDHDSPWFFGKFGYVLKNVQPVEFTPVKGSLGFFDWRKNL